MKMTFKFLKEKADMQSLISLLLLLAGTMAGIFAPGLLLAVGIAGSDGVGRFDDGIATLDEANENSPDMLRAFINKVVKEQNPTSTPLDTIFREVAAVRGEKGAMNEKGERSMVYQYYAIDSKPVRSYVKTAYNKIESAVTAEIEVENPKIFSRKDTIIVRGVSGYNPGESTPSGRPLILWVEKRLNNGKLLVRAINGKTIGEPNSGISEIPDIPANAPLFRSGRAHNELDVQTAPFNAWPNKTTNYCQIFKAQIEAGSIFQLQEKELRWTPNQNERLAINDMKMTTEAAFLFGEKAIFRAPYDSDSDAEGNIYTTGGIVHEIKRTIDYDKENGISEKFFNATLRNIFTGNGGNPTRVAFMGSGFTEMVSNIESVKRQIGAKDQNVVWGIRWDEITSPFGSLLCKRHEVLDIYGWEDLCIVLDMDNVAKVTFSGLERMVLDLKKSGQRNVDAAVLTEIAGTELYYPSTHAIIKPTGFDLKGSIDG